MSASAVRSSLCLSRFLSNNRSVFINPIHKSLYSLGQRGTPSVTRSFYVLSRNKNLKSFEKIRLTNAYICSCGVHSKGDEELVAFLKDEIENEKKAEKTFDASKLNGFQVELNEAEVTLTKKLNNEIIKITSNVNNSVDAEDTVLDPNDAKEPQEAEMLAKPEFTIEISKGNKILSFHCTFSQTMQDDEPGSEPYNDVFQISEISIHEGEFEDHTYTVSGDIMDGYLYDLLMNYLEERGITNDFADKMMAFFTSYEHKLYISLLQKMKSFVEK
ncbi:complement component 1 Q subcomponent-binding protein, mitochondrial-like [Argiope bruennichi]|uniref:Complement component 1 Q subcomponent-binding like protein n=1 Tax=Argiope bruennichi TaxID=94029 RepID=A0A8T0FB43_ARGBR|nr:complement component 1 Q subcomponent-binding protein, mitochondrial-like [Argiope bruennichi]KAF8787488.1 Complement component 1 Q subcomponent-binding like protein [Argiope bruennichi]